jgi:DNA end-binding protein Ku
LPDPQDTQVRGHAFWSGTITFGLVSIPVALFSGSRPGGVSLRMLAPDGTPLRRRYFCPEEDRMLDKDDIVRGYAIEKDTYVIITDDELAALAPKKSKEIDLRLFVPVEQIDPAYFDRAYILTPIGDISKPYRLLAEAMEKSGRAGIATFVMRGKEHLVAILSENGILRAETLRFADEIRSPEQIGLPAPAKVPEEVVRKYSEEIRAASSPELNTDMLQDRYAENLSGLVKKKQQRGEDVVRVADVQEPEEEEGGQVIDLMEVLKRTMGVHPAVNGKNRSRQQAATAGEAEHSDLKNRSRKELYESARDLDIPGRSGMSKDELARAIQQSKRKGSHRSG